MRLELMLAASLFLGDSAVASSGWAVTEARLSIPEADKSLVGRVVCGEGRFDTTEGGVRCRTCPDFTSGAGSDEGLEIGNMVRGRFTAAKAEGEWILDTDGCESHFKSFGGAILLGFNAPKAIPATPQTALGYRLVTKATSGPLALVWYKPGFRLNDCLVFGGEKTRTQLVCNEADMAQGEVVGHISAMEVSRRGIRRWRLLRWYDNSGTSMVQVVSVVPTEMRRIGPEDGQPRLQVKMKFFETTREFYEKGSEHPGKRMTLEFKRKGQRFFATERTQEHLERIGRLTRKMLE